MALLCSFEETVDPDERVVVAYVPFLAEPRGDADVLVSSLWRTMVRLTGGTEARFTRVAVEEWNLDAIPPEMTGSTNGWVQSDTLGRSQTRHLFHTQAPDDSPERWVVHGEGRYLFRCYWAPVRDAGLLAFQQAWVDRAAQLLC